MKSKTIKKNQKGQAALLIVLITMTLLLFVSLVLTNMVTRRTKMTRDTLQSVQAYYLADAGTELLLYRIKALPEGDSDKIEPESFAVGATLLSEDFDGDGNIDVRVIKELNIPPVNLVLKTTGYYKNTARAVELSW